MNIEDLQFEITRQLETNMGLSTLEVLELQDRREALNDIEDMFEREYQEKLEEKLDAQEADYEQQLDDLEAERNAAYTRAYQTYFKYSAAIEEHVKDRELLILLQDAIDHEEEQ